MRMFALKLWYDKNAIRAVHDGTPPSLYGSGQSECMFWYSVDTDFFANTGAQGIVGYIAIKLPYVVHKNGAHRLPIVPHLLAGAIEGHLY